MDILLISDTPEKWMTCLPVFEQEGYSLSTVPNMPDALSHIRNTPPVLTILDLFTDAREIRQAIISMLMVNAAVHTAVTSDLSEQDFHDTMEGLGILMSLPPVPEQKDILALLAALKKVC